MRKFAAVCLIVTIAFLVMVLSSPVRLITPRRPAPPSASAVPVVQTAAPAAGGLEKAYASLPLSFEENRGQTDSRVKFLSRGGGYTMFFTPDEVVLSLHKRVKADEPIAKDPRVRRNQVSRRGRMFQETVLRMTLDGAVPPSAVAGLEPAPGKSNYFKGKDPSKWLAEIPQYSRLQYSGVYPGIDVAYYGNQQRLEYDFIVAPGADPGCIKLRFTGADEVRVDASGELVLSLNGSEIREMKPVVYQDIAGVRHTVAAEFVSLGKHITGFKLGAYDRTQRLVIDPVLTYATYLGGGTESGFGIKVDGSGNMYVTGTTASPTFPLVNPIQGALTGNLDTIYVFKLNTAGTALIYSTFFGGTHNDNLAGGGLAIDSSGNVYLTGQTASPDFPVVNAIQSTLPGAPIFKSIDGGVTWSKSGNGLNNITITHLAINPNTPSKLYASTPDGRGFNGAIFGPKTGDVFESMDGGATWASTGFINISPSFSSDVQELVSPATGTVELYATTRDVGRGDGNGGPPILGGLYQLKGGAWTNGADFLSNIIEQSSAFTSVVVDPVVTDQIYFTTNADGLFVRQSLLGNPISIGQSTLNAFDTEGLALDPNNHTTVFVAKNFSGIFKSINGGGAFTKLTGSIGSAQDVENITIDPANSNVIYAGTFDAVNGPGTGLLKSTDGGATFNPTPITDSVFRVQLFNSNTLFTVSEGKAPGALSRSTDAAASFTHLNVFNSGVFDAVVDPTNANTIYAAIGTNATAFVTKLNASGSAIVYSTYLGGSADENGSAIAVDSQGNAYVTGFSLSSDFPTTGGAFQTAHKSPFVTSFVTKINAAGSAVVYSTLVGGTNDDRAVGIAVDGAGNAYVTGNTSSTDFPTTASALQAANPNPLGQHGFLYKVNASGSALLYSTYIGGTETEEFSSIAIDGAGAAYMTGSVTSGDFPVRNAFQPALTFSFNPRDVFIVKIDPSQSGAASLVYGTYLGGITPDEFGAGIAVDSNNLAYVTGTCSSTDFPTKNTLQPFGGNSDAFIAKFDCSQSGAQSLIYSTFLGGAGSDQGTAIAVDNSGTAYVLGVTGSSNFPVTPGAIQSTLAGATNLFIAKVFDLTPIITSSNVITGTQNVPLSFQITAKNNPTVFSITALPPGLSLNASTGLISGTPTANGTTSATLTVADSSGSATQAVIFAISGLPGSPAITSPLNVPGVVNVSFTYQITASNSPTSFGATNLPPGFAVDSTLGFVTALPMTTGTFTIVVSATNAVGTGFAVVTIGISPNIGTPAITSALTVTATVGTPFMYQITANYNPTSFNATGLPLGLSVDPATGLISGTPSQAGMFNVTLTATNAKGSGTAILVLNVGTASGAPLIVSTLSLVETVGGQFSYQIVAVGNQPITFTAAPLPPGLTLAVDTISGAPTQAGAFAVTLTATNAVGSDTKTLLILVTNSSGAGSSGSNTNTDSDGDGFPDELETALGTNPNDPASTPFKGKPAGASNALALTKLQINLNFSKTNSDSISLQGTLPIPQGFAALGQHVAVDIGGVVRSFTLDKSGSGKSGKDSFKVATKPSTKSKFSVTIGKASLAASFTDEGLTNANASKAPKSIPVIVLLIDQSQFFRADKNVSFTAKKGKTGSAK